MDYETLKEMWEFSEGGEMPKEFRSTCESYYKHKCVFRTLPFDDVDFANCVLAYKLYKTFAAAVSKAGKRDAKEKGE